MLPIILASNSDKNTEKYIRSFASHNNIQEVSIHRFSPEKKEFSIEMVREIKKELHLRFTVPQLYILYKFDTASIEAQNALLKTLEEKNDSYQFILVVSQVHALLPTVSSRCTLVNLNKEVIIDVSDKQNLSFDNLIHEKKRYMFFSDKQFQRIDADSASNFLDSGISYFRSRLLSDVNAAKILKRLLEAKTLLIRNNANPQLLIDNLLIFIDKTYTMNS